MSGARIEQAFSEVVKGSTISGAMRKVGYAETTAARTNKITRTQKWQSLVAKHLGDAKIARLHDKILNKRESFVVSDGAQSGAHVEIGEQPHSDALRALDLAYKLKGKYPRDDESGGNKTLVVIVAGQSADRFDVAASKPEFPTA